MTVGPITEADIQAHVDGRLPPEREAMVAAWLLSHPDEASRAAAYRRHTALLRDSLAPVLEEALPPSLDLRLRGRSAPRRIGFRRAAVAAAAAGLLLVGGSGGWLLRSVTEPATVGTAALAREGMASYAVYASDAARPVELAANQRGVLDRWFSERLSRPIRAPDLRAAGLRLVGGRLVATEHGPAGLYLYGDGSGRRIALYVRPMEVERTDHMQARASGAVRGWTWADDGLGFGVFGDGASDMLHGTADMVRAQMS